MRPEPPIWIVWSSCLVAKSQILIEPSSLAEAMVAPSGATSRSKMTPSWANQAGAARFQDVVLYTTRCECWVDPTRWRPSEVARSTGRPRFVGRVESDGFIGGRTDGQQILVGRNVARPELTLLHEVAHAVVGVEHGHGEPWRRVYATAVGEVFDDDTAERELRRIRWVYDKSYRDSPLP